MSRTSICLVAWLLDWLIDCVLYMALSCVPRRGRAPRPPRQSDQPAFALPRPPAPARGRSVGLGAARRRRAGRKNLLERDLGFACRSINRGTESLSKYGMKWISGGAKRQCGRALARPRPRPRMGVPQSSRGETPARPPTCRPRRAGGRRWFRGNQRRR
jgi:hypothetical protein